MRAFTSMPRCIRVVLSAALLFVGSAAFAGKAPVASVVRLAPADTVLPATKITRAFEDLGSPHQPLKLMTTVANYTFSIPVSPREKVRSGLLHLETTNSTALIMQRSELSVTVNGQILAQYLLDPQHTRAIRDIELPGDFLKPGYNDVRIGVVQHYTNDCEDPASPELWTQIDGKRSGVTLNFDGTVANPSPRITQLSSAFDRRGWMQRRLSVVSGSDRLSETELSAASLAVQGLALRLDYRPLAVDVFTSETLGEVAGASLRGGGLAPAVVNGRDVLIVGKNSEVSRYLGQDIGSMVSGPFVGVFSANGGDSVIIVVSGSTDAELLQAARTLADPEFKYTDTAVEHATSLALPPTAYLNTGVNTAFDTLKFRTRTLSALGSSYAVLEFRAPPTYAAYKGEFATLSLQISYSAGMRKASTFDVYLNDTFIKSIPIDNEQGAQVPATIKVPAYLVKPGFNVLSFQALLLPATEQCTGGLASGTVTIFEESKFMLPVSVAPVQAPDLERYSRSLWPQLPDFNLVMTNHRPETASAALELLGFLAQRNRAAVESHMLFAVPATGNYTLVGPFAGIAEPVLASWPLNKYQWLAEGAHMGVLQEVQGKRVRTGFFAKDSETLRAGIEQLRTKGFWRNLVGSAGIVDTQEQTMRVEGATVEAASLPPPVRRFNLDWRILLALGMFGVTVLALIVAFVVRRKINRRTAKYKANSRE